MTGVLIRRAEGDTGRGRSCEHTHTHPRTHTHTRREGHVTTEAETGVMQLQAKDAKDCWPHQELEEARKSPPLQVSEGTQPCSLISHFQPPEL